MIATTRVIFGIFLPIRIMQGPSAVERLYSSAHRGSATREPDAPRPTWPSFARRCIDRELRRLDSLRTVVQGTVDARSVHKMRTTTRRLRVALRLFADVLPREAAAIEKELRWLARRLGPLRDLDVYCANLRKTTNRHDPSAELAAYALHVRAECDEARGELAPVLSGPGMNELLWRAHALLAHCNERVDDGAAALHERAGKHLHAAAKHLLERGRKIDERSEPEELHRLRIHDKRFRYELELLSEIFLEPLLAAAQAARKLQNFLGQYQDACTACERLRRDAREQGAGRAAEELAALLRTQEQRARALRARFPRHWRQLEEAIERDWRKALAAT